MSTSTAERLIGYGAFPSSVIDTVSSHAEFQASFDDYASYLGAVGIDVDNLAKDLKLVDIRPKEHDPAHALVVHLPMANPLDPNQLMQVATIAGTNPDKRVIAMANPSGPGYNAGTVGLRDLWRIATKADFLPVVAELEEYLVQENIELTDEYGTSYGSDKQLASLLGGEHAVKSATFHEPPSIKKRTPVKLGEDFKSSAAALDEYVQRSGLEIFNRARQDSVSGRSYELGLARPTNLAVGLGIARGDFGSRFGQAMGSHQETVATLSWGSESELAIDSVVNFIGMTNARIYPGRVWSMRMVGEKHAAANDIHLQAAIVLQGQVNAARSDVGL